MRTPGRAVSLLLLCAGAGAAHAAGPQEAWARVDRAQVPAEEARGRIATVVQALHDAGMPGSATVLLAALATDAQQSEGVRRAARDELASSAAQAPGVAQLLIADGDPGKLPPALALQLARAHLERALQLAPPPEGVAFEPLPAAPGARTASTETPEPLPRDLSAEMGQPGGQPVPQPTPAPAPPPPPGARSAARELDEARALSSSVSPDDPFGPAAAEVAGLAALAAGDDAAATREFLAIVDRKAKKGDKAAQEMRDRAYLQLARLAYQSGDDARATALYQRVSRGAPEWLDALFEASWSRFRTGEDEKALGNLLTLHAPFFQGRFFPESFVLEALVLYENCRYADARAALAGFEQRYRPIYDGLTALLDRVQTPQAASEFLSGGALGVEQGVAPAAREEVARIEQDADVQGAQKLAVALAGEIDGLDKRPAVFRDSALIARVAPLDRQARVLLLTSAGQKLLSRLSAERAELRELLGQSLRLSYEIAGREKELATDPDAGLASQPHKARPQVGDDEVEWPFEGEYWRDELGSYQYQLGRRCKKPRPPLQTAGQPVSAPATALGAPEGGR